MSEVNSAWTLEVDLEKGQIRRVRNFSTADGVKALPLEKKLRDVFMGIAGLAEMVGDEFSSTAIENKAAELAYGWARVAQENEKVRIAVRWLVETNAWTDAIVPTVLVGGSVAWKYNLLPGEMGDKIGEGMAKFSGAIPMSPEEEAALAKAAEQAQAAAQEHERMEPEPEPEPTASETEPPINGDEDEVETPSPSDGPTVVPLTDADLKPDS